MGGEARGQAGLSRGVGGVDQSLAAAGSRGSTPRRAAGCAAPTPATCRLPSFALRRRRVEGVNISPFISNLPFGKDTTSFTTPDASGSTSQVCVGWPAAAQPRCSAGAAAVSSPRPAGMAGPGLDRLVLNSLPVHLVLAAPACLRRPPTSRRRWRRGPPACWLTKTRAPRESQTVSTTKFSTQTQLGGRVDGWERGVQAGARAAVKTAGLLGWEWRVLTTPATAIPSTAAAATL